MGHLNDVNPDDKIETKAENHPTTPIENVEIRGLVCEELINCQVSHNLFFMQSDNPNFISAFLSIDKGLSTTENIHYPLSHKPYCCLLLNT